MIAMQDKLVADKHIDAAAVEKTTGFRTINAAERKPRTTYRGKHPDDEDFTHVLQHGWGEEAPVVTADRGMIAKAIEFRRDLKKTGSEKCLRGVIVLPAGKDAQIAALRGFLDGTTDVIPARKGADVPRTLDDVFQQNIGIDLSIAHPKAVELCDCEWTD